MESRIIYQSDFGDDVTITLGDGPRANREPGDVCLARTLALDCPLRIAVLVRVDGTVVEWYTQWSAAQPNTYWHLSNGSAEDGAGRVDLSGRTIPPKVLTPAQRETLIRIWGGQIRPFGVRGSCGAPVMAWVNADISEIETVLGRKVYLTAACDTTETIERPARAQADNTDAREAILDQAVESGQISGAN